MSTIKKWLYGVSLAMLAFALIGLFAAITVPSDEAPGAGAVLVLVLWVAQSVLGIAAAKEGKKTHPCGTERCLATYDHAGDCPVK